MRIKVSIEEYNHIVFDLSFLYENKITFEDYIKTEYNKVKCDKPDILPNKNNFYEIVENGKKIGYLIHNGECYKFSKLSNVEWIEPKFFAIYHDCNLDKVPLYCLNKFYKNVKYDVEFWLELRDVYRNTQKSMLRYFNNNSKSTLRKMKSDFWKMWMIYYS